MAEIEVGLDGTEVLIIGAMDNTDIVEVAAILGPPGPRGFKGDKGTAAIGTVTTGPAGSSALVADTSNDPNHAVFNFTIPRGDKGETGTLELGTTTTGAPGTQAIVTDRGTPTHGIFDFVIPRGDKGDRATFAIGTVSTGTPGSNASVVNSGTSTDGIMNFVIPRGDKGATGTLELGTFTTGAPGSNVAITNTGTPEHGVFNFSIPRGDKGATGTLSLGSVATGAPGSDVVITNTGTPEAGIINFTIPRGDKGATGTMSLGTVATGAAGSNVQITNTGTPEAGVFNFVIPRGDRGIAATITVGTVTTLAPGAPAAITNSGTAADARFDFSIPQGPQGLQGFKGDKGDRGTIALGTVTTTNPGSDAVVTMRGTASDGIVDFSLPRGAGVQVAGLTGQYLRKRSNSDFDTEWVDVPAPINMATTDTVQSFTAVKTFTVAPVVPEDSFAIASVNGLATSLSSKFSATNLNVGNVTTTLTYGLTGTSGSATTYSRSNHSHGTPPAQVITPGVGITATASGVDYTIANTGVLSNVAGSNVTVSAATGNVTVGVVASPAFTNVTASGTVTATGNISAAQLLEGAIRVYSPNNPQPMTGYATESFVDTRVNAIVDAAPGTLDTLNELAAALGDDPNFATTISNQIATKANDNAVVHLAGTETVTGNKTFSGLLRATGNVVETEQGVARLDLGVVNVTGGTARIVFEDPTATAGQRVWQIDTSSGAFRWYTPGSVKMSLSAAGALNTGGAITENGTRVYSANNKVPVTGLSATGTPSATTFLRGDNTWGTIDVSNLVTTNTAQTVTGAKTFSAATAAAIPVAIAGAASQTGNLTEWRNSAGTVLTRVASDGTIYRGNKVLGREAEDSEILGYMGVY